MATNRKRVTVSIAPHLLPAISRRAIGHRDGLAGWIMEYVEAGLRAEKPMRFSAPRRAEAQLQDEIGAQLLGELGVPQGAAVSLNRRASGDR